MFGTLVDVDLYVDAAVAVLVYQRGTCGIRKLMFQGLSRGVLYPANTLLRLLPLVCCSQAWRTPAGCSCASPRVAAAASSHCVTSLIKMRSRSSCTILVASGSDSALSASSACASLALLSLWRFCVRGEHQSAALPAALSDVFGSASRRDADLVTFNSLRTGMLSLSHALVGVFRTRSLDFAQSSQSRQREGNLASCSKLTCSETCYHMVGWLVGKVKVRRHNTECIPCPRCRQLMCPALRSFYHKS